MTAITFIKEPPYVVDFTQFPKSSLRYEEETIKTVALKALKLIPVIGTSFAKAAYTTFSYAGTSFKHIVLGFYGSWSNFRPPSDFYFVVFKVAFWALNLVWGTLATTFRLTSQELAPPSSEFLRHYANDGIDISHIKTNKSGIDVSAVSPDVQVATLAQIYDEINFDNPDEPGYMKETSRQEYSTIYSKEALKESLRKFIKNVNERVAFLGTPPQHDTPRLMAFYQQIENAVRFAIHKSNQDIAAFKAKNGQGPYEEEALRTYKGLLEDRARIAIDLAISGKHCGARFMGEAMTVYENAKGVDGELGGTLQEAIIELLAQKRYSIAKQHIQMHLGADTHAFNKYMANLGSILGLPGTEHIIEHLDTSLDRDRFLTLFFKTYTVDFIITTIQDEIKRSQVFREKITDWLMDQSKEWKQEEYNKNSAAITTAAQAAISSPVQDNEKLTLFTQLVEHLKTTKAHLPKLGESWDDYITDVFTLPEVRSWRDSQFAIAGLAPMQALMQRKQKLEDLKILCSEPLPIGQELETLKNKAPHELLDELIKRSQIRVKIDKVRVIIPLAPETILRIFANPNLLQEAISGNQSQSQRTEFLEQLAENHLVEFDQKGISPALMEWLTVSQKIFSRQEPMGVA